jgi:hypothetical protein
MNKRIIDHRMKMVGKLASRKVSKRRLDRAMRAYEKAAGITKEQTRPE